jgi:hypothetical protein
MASGAITFSITLFNLFVARQFVNTYFMERGLPEEIRPPSQQHFRKVLTKYTQSL